MTADVKKETLGFQTEAKQLLHLMIHSLYSNREIFLRELISNASDAIDKLRFESLSDESLLQGDSNYEVRVELDKDANTLTISDNGIGMSREEVIEHLGTIAKSGTAAFLESLTGDEQKDSQLIGQFGVGFYSAFIVADRVEVHTRKAGADVSEGVLWDSQGEADFSVETRDRDARGTSITLFLKSDCAEFSDDWRVRSIIKKYSDHISVPVLMQAPPTPPAEDEEESETVQSEPEFESVNSATALWTRSRSEVSDEEYQEFYKHVSHDFEDPLLWSHNKVEGKLEYTSLLYIPAKAPFDLWNREMSRGLKLYVQRTFIMDEAEQFLPLYLRFVKGVVDSNDLSLNVSREILQKDPAVESMRSALTKRVLDMLSKMAKSNDGEKYAAFWQQFGPVLKEGPAEDMANKEKIAKLLRFSTTHTDNEEQDQSLEDYVSRMQDSQEKIYYVVAENFITAKKSPHLEVFRKKGIEVLLLSDRVDDWLMNQLQEFDSKAFQDVGRGALELDIDSEEEKAQQEKINKDSESLVERLGEVLKEDVSEVRATARLTDSVACLVVGEFDMGAQMRRIMEAAGQDVPESKPILEINPAHTLAKLLDQEADEARFDDLAHIVLDQATLVEGGQLEDPTAFVSRLNKLLIEMGQD